MEKTEVLSLARRLARLPSSVNCDLNVKSHDSILGAIVVGTSCSPPGAKAQGMASKDRGKEYGILRSPLPPSSNLGGTVPPTVY